MREVLGYYREFAAVSPDDLSKHGSMGTRPDGTLVVSLTICYSGDLDEGTRVLRPIESLGLRWEFFFNP